MGANQSCRHIPRIGIATCPHQSNICKAAESIRVSSVCTMSVASPLLGAGKTERSHAPCTPCASFQAGISDDEASVLRAGMLLRMADDMDEVAAWRDSCALVCVPISSIS